MNITTKLKLLIEYKLQSLLGRRNFQSNRPAAPRPASTRPGAHLTSLLLLLTRDGSRQQT